MELSEKEISGTDFCCAVPVTFGKVMRELLHPMAAQEHVRWDWWHLDAPGWSFRRQQAPCTSVWMFMRGWGFLLSPAGKAVKLQASRGTWCLWNGSGMLCWWWQLQQRIPFLLCSRGRNRDRALLPALCPSLHSPHVTVVSTAVTYFSRTIFYPA